MSVFVGCYGQQEQGSLLPVTISNTTVIRGIEGCPTQQVRDDQLSSIRNEINDRLNSTAIPHLACPSCGGAGEWSKIASLDMIGPNQQCPLLTLSVTSEGVVDSLLVVIQYPTHQMVVPTHMCVERLLLINNEAQMLAQHRG